MSEETLGNPEQTREWNDVACVRFKWFFSAIARPHEIDRYRKPALHLQPELESPGDTLRGFIQANGIAVLNVAGLRQSREPFIAEFVMAILDAAHV